MQVGALGTEGSDGAGHDGRRVRRVVAVSRRDPAARTSLPVGDIVAIPSRPIPDLARAIQRRDIDQLFAGAHFPSVRKQIVDYARDHFASADLLAVLDSIPDRIYHGPGDIFTAIQELGR
jgi:hypothetical protein